MIRFRKPAAARIIPWGNGLGESRELLASQADGNADVGTADGQALHWRISTTPIVRSSPFSHYPGIRRKIVLLSGRGFTLDFAAHGNATLLTPYSSAAFLGDWPTQCRLMDGPVRVLNLVLSEGIAEPSVMHMSIEPNVEIETDERCTAIFCARGEVTVRSGGETMSQESSQAVSRRISQAMSEEMSEEMSQETSEHISEGEALEVIGSDDDERARRIRMKASDAGADILLIHIPHPPIG